MAWDFFTGNVRNDVNNLITCIEINVKTRQTSLKIFKHYKLKPNFQIIKNCSIIKDKKAKDRVGDMRDKPRPQNFGSQLILI